MEPLKDIIERLNISDESNNIEAKRGSSIDKSILETVCAFSNEPDLGGGLIVLGVVREEQLLFPQYEVVGVTQTDKLQLDLASQCASMFNVPVRPEIEIEISNDFNVLKIFIPELHASQKPLYFKNEGLPRGAYRRIGSSDQRCTDDDMILFYNQTERLIQELCKEAQQKTWMKKQHLFIDNLGLKSTLMQKNLITMI